MQCIVQHDIQDYSIVFTVIQWLLARYLINCWWEFYKIYNFGAVGMKMNCLDFEISRSKVKGQVHSDSKYGQISTWGGIFSRISGMLGLTSMTQLLITRAASTYAAMHEQEGIDILL